MLRTARLVVVADCCLALVAPVLVIAAVAAAEWLEYSLVLTFELLPAAEPEGLAV